MVLCCGFSGAVSARKHHVVIFLPDVVPDDERFFIRIGSDGSEIKWIDSDKHPCSCGTTMVIGVDLL